jgi:hypothetical protein
MTQFEIDIVKGRITQEELDAMSADERYIWATRFNPDPSRDGIEKDTFEAAREEAGQ